MSTKIVSLRCLLSAWAYFSDNPHSSIQWVFYQRAICQAQWQAVRDRLVNETEVAFGVARLTTWQWNERYDREEQRGLWELPGGEGKRYWAYVQRVSGCYPSKRVWRQKAGGTEEYSRQKAYCVGIIEDLANGSVAGRWMQRGVSPKMSWRAAGELRHGMKILVTYFGIYLKGNVEPSRPRHRRGELLITQGQWGAVRGLGLHPHIPAHAARAHMRHPKGFRQDITHQLRQLCQHLKFYSFIYYWPSYILPGNNAREDAISTANKKVLTCHSARPTLSDCSKNQSLLHHMVAP